MQKKSSIKDLYSEIRKYLFYMIPEKWNNIYLYASVIQRENSEETGEMYFYYFPKSLLKRNPVNVYQIPQKFNIEEKDFLNLASQLYDIIKQLKNECAKFEKNNWTNITISIENAEFLAEYNYDNLFTSQYSSNDRIAIWQHKYLDYDLDRFNKYERQAVKSYLREEEQGLHQTTSYTETFYQPHEHNNIQYDISKNEDQYIKLDDNTKDFTIVEDSQYQIKGKLNRRTRTQKKYNETMMNNQKSFKEEPDLDNEEIVIRNQILKY